MKTLEQFIQQLYGKAYNKKSLSVYEFLPLLKSYESEDWKSLLRIKNQKPQNTLLFQDDYLKVLLIQWDSFQQSKKHGHPNGGGLIKVLSGNLVESLFDTQQPDQLIGKNWLRTESISFVHDDVAQHIVENPSHEPAVSLHVYAPAIYIPGFVSASKAALRKNKRVGVAA